MTEGGPGGSASAPASEGPVLSGVRRIGVVGRQGTREAADVLGRLAAFAAREGIELYPESSLEGEGIRGAGTLEGREGEVDLLLTLGGDGTLLRGARKVAAHGTPVLGVNLGRLGFLTSLPASHMEKGLERLGAGEARLDPRSTLEGVVAGEDGRVRSRLWALNDFVVHKAGVARVVRLDLFVGEDHDLEEVASFSGDGVMVASPTGSTAYSLSAGGPVVVPATRCLVVTPISPHTLAMRPLVLPEECRLTVRGLDRMEELVVTEDGQVATPVGPGDEVVVWKGRRPVTLVRFPGETFFHTLRRKLNWSI